MDFCDVHEAAKRSGKRRGKPPRTARRGSSAKCNAQKQKCPEKLKGFSLIIKMRGQLIKFFTAFKILIKPKSPTVGLFKSPFLLPLFTPLILALPYALRFVLVFLLHN